MPFGAPPVGGIPMATSMGAMLGAPGSGPPGAAGDAVRADLDGVSADIRRVVQQMDGAAEQMDMLAKEYPTLAPAAEQVRTTVEALRTRLAQAMVDLARQTPEQTTSGLALPMGGGGGL